jgi:rhodanese-related sulfurtransferase
VLIFLLRENSMLNEDKNVHQEQIAHYHSKLQYEIDSWDLSEALKNGANMVVIDARSSAAYNQEHIPGAINFPWRMIDKDTAAERLDPTVEYVTYCDGIGCNASTKSALRLAQLGYKVKELMGGLDWWKRDQHATSRGKSEDTQPTIACGCDGN